VSALLRYNCGTLTLTPALRGGERLRCYTGKLDWKAKRGANVPIDA
jgi:hypothetical protein